MDLWIHVCGSFTVCCWSTYPFARHAITQRVCVKPLDTKANFLYFRTDTEWQKIEQFVNDFGKNHGEDALQMVLSVVSVLGMINLVFYTGFGVFSWPMGLIRGTRSARSQIEEIRDQHLVNQWRINALRDKERIEGRLTNRERRQLTQFEEAERQVVRDEATIEDFRSSLWYKCRLVIRPLEIAIGVTLGLLAVLIWVSLLLTNIDKAMHGQGMHMGYMLTSRTLPNPIDMILVCLQKVFPLDYIMILVMTWFLVLCTMSGIRNLGVRVFGVKLYSLRSKRTRPQGLLLTSVTLMVTVLAINIFFYCVSPQYATFGNQKYKSVNVTQDSETEFEITANTTLHTLTCDASVATDRCTSTRNSALLTRFFFKVKL